MKQIIMFVKLVFITPLAAQLSIFEDTGKFGCKNSEQKVVIPALYDKIITSDNFAAIVKQNKWALIERTGKQLSSFINDSIVLFTFAPVALVKRGAVSDSAGRKSGGKWGIVDTYGNERIPLKYDEIHPSYFNHDNEKLFIVRVNNQWGAINLDGKEVITVNYQQVEECYINTMSSPEKS